MRHARRVLLMAIMLCSVARADEMTMEGVFFRASQPVAQAGTLGSIKVVLKNDSKNAVLVPSSGFVLRGQAIMSGLLPEGGQTVADDPDWSEIKPGEFVTFAWNKKDNKGKFVPPGNYTFELGGAVSISNEEYEYYLSCTVALTPSGKLAGNSLFPLVEGNEWVYGAADGSIRKMKVVSKNASWSKVTGLAGGTRWVTLSGSALVAKPAVSGGSADLFRFGRPLGHSYLVNFAPGLKEVWLEVGSTNETVEGKICTFKGCYRLDVMKPLDGLLPAMAPVGSFWFAPGVGMVRYSRKGPEGLKTYDLFYAKIAGIDKKVYELEAVNELLSDED